MAHDLALTPWFFCILTVFAAAGSDDDDDDDDETVVVAQKKLGDTGRRKSRNFFNILRKLDSITVVQRFRSFVRNPKLVSINCSISAS